MKCIFITFTSYHSYFSILPFLNPKWWYNTEVRSYLICSKLMFLSFSIMYRLSKCVYTYLRVLVYAHCFCDVSFNVLFLYVLGYSLSIQPDLITDRQRFWKNFVYTLPLPWYEHIQIFLFLNLIVLRYGDQLMLHKLSSNWCVGCCRVKCTW